MNSDPVKQVDQPHFLVLARHYPPEVSGGARRPYLIVKALRQLGFRVTLVTPFELDDEDYICVPSRALGGQLSQEKTATQLEETTKSLRFHELFGIRNFLRQWLLWPDPEIRWAKKVERVILKIGVKPDGIFTTSPPESIHVTGARLAKRLGVRWVAEFRDTWFFNPHREILERSAMRRCFERRIARKALRRVSALVAVSETVMQDIESFAPKNTRKAIIGHFSTAPTQNFCLPKADINLVHSGGFCLSDRQRELSPLLEILENAYKRQPKLHLHIAGKLSAGELAQIEQSPIRITHHGLVSLEQSQAMQRAADGLILCTPANSHALPGKYAEYLLAKRPIFYLGGGQWLDLIDNSAGLRKLEVELVNLKKGETITNQQSLSANDAALILSELLNHQT